MLDFKDISVLSFDCYGTLIDWERGILSALEPLLSRSQARPSESDLLRLYGQYEREAQARTPFINYRAVLQRVMINLADQLGVAIKPGEENLLAESMRGWRPFADTVPALKILKARFKLGIISNVDADLFHYSQAQLKVPFDWVFTSEQLGSYKPSEHNFRCAMSTFGVHPHQQAHVAQSLYHDIVPARDLGLNTVWVNRRGAASTPVIDCQPDLEVPDLETLAGLVTTKKLSQIVAYRRC